MYPENTLNKGDYPCDIKHGIYSLFLYSDIVAPVLVGDAHVPLLRTIPVQGPFGDVVTLSMDRLHYVPLCTSNFDEVEIHITTDQGKLISFEFGKVIVKLHFRPRRLLYL